MKILVTGAGGMLGRELVNQATAAGVAMTPLTRGELDVTDAVGTRDRIGAERPEWVVHCAAYTKVDQAEVEHHQAYAVNETGTRNVAIAARAVSARVLYVSTDYVFNGRNTRPWTEDDPTGPLSVYGRSKLAGELSVRDVLGDRHLIVRTQWLFGAGGPNFIATILRRAAEGAPLDVVTDQIGAPTYARDLAAAILRLIEVDARGTVHVANAGMASWFEVAQYALERAGIEAELRPCTTAQFTRPATRPAYSVLDCSRFTALTGGPLRSWREAVDAFLEAEGGAKGRHFGQ